MERSNFPFEATNHSYLKAWRGLLEICRMSELILAKSEEGDPLTRFGG
jgi:hypothetical protein